MDQRRDHVKGHMPARSRKRGGSDTIPIIVSRAGLWSPPLESLLVLYRNQNYVAITNSESKKGGHSVEFEGFSPSEFEGYQILALKLNA